MRLRIAACVLLACLAGCTRNDTGDRQVVILDLGEGRFRPEPVTVGRRGGGMIEIVTGVAAGDRVVSAATFLIDAESNLNAALAALAAPEADQ